jgi:hypothetical protein
MLITQKRNEKSVKHSFHQLKLNFNLNNLN